MIDRSITLGAVGVGNVNSKYLVLLVVVVLLAVVLKIGNPDKKYSRKQFWQNATVESVAEVPESALEAGNRNGPVLMWAAMVVSDSAILKELVARGADINEADEIFMGSPLTAAISEGNTNEVIDALIDLGADVNVTVFNRQTALMVAAQYNRNPGLATRLLTRGVDVDAVDGFGKTAIDHARANDNEEVLREIRAFGQARR